MSAFTWIGVAVLGGLGAITRFLLDGLISSRFGRGFPFGTFAINVTGAFLLGLLDGVALTGDALILAGTATLGSYTTFSTWMLETQRLTEDGAFGAGLMNIGASVAVGLGAVALGRLIGAHA